MKVARVLKAKSTKLDYDFTDSTNSCQTSQKDFLQFTFSCNSLVNDSALFVYIRRRTRKLLWRINAIPNKWKACCFYGGYSIAQEDRCQWLPRAPEPHPQRVIVIDYVLFDIKVSFCFMELSSVRVCIKINYTIKYVHTVLA